MSVTSARVPATKATPTLNSRQRELLRLLESLGGSVAMLDFQKLLFLYSEGRAAGRLYDFVPYKFGAFSFTSYADRRKLIDRGFLVDTEQSWKLTTEGRRVIGRMETTKLNSVALGLPALRGDALVADTYRRFPYYAIRSEIAERVLSGDNKALARIHAAGNVSRQHFLHTIGYEGHSLESYLNVLIRSGVSLLCDVRKNPLSRKYGFSKTTLAKGCNGVGIRYEHLPELGIASDQRQCLETQEDYDALFEQYERTWLPKQGEALQRIFAWIQDGARVALTCYEHSPQQCHRHCVSDAIGARFGKEFCARHL